MTHPIPVGAIFEVHAKDNLAKVIGRVIHLGDGICNTEIWSNGGWHLSRANVPLTNEQLVEWLKRMTGQSTAFGAMCSMPVDR